jgi:hypothetical protein
MASTRPQLSAVPPSTITQVTQRLDALLSAMIIANQRLESAIGAHRDALRGADQRGVEAAISKHHDAIKQVAFLEQQRRELVTQAIRSVPALTGMRPEQLTLTLLASHADQHARAGLSAKARTLRELVVRVQGGAATLKTATMSLLAHMEGLMRQVGQQLSHAGTYSRRGVVEPGGTVISAVDMQS